MKFENLTFSCKGANGGDGRIRYTMPSVRISLYNNKQTKYQYQKVVIAFHMCDSLYSSNTHCRYAIAGNRCYFLWCGKSENAYALGKISRTSKGRRLVVMFNKELSKFVSDNIYTPKLDNECGLWYIEY